MLRKEELETERAPWQVEGRWGGGWGEVQDGAFSLGLGTQVFQKTHPKGNLWREVSRVRCRWTVLLRMILGRALLRVIFVVYLIPFEFLGFL